MAEFIRARDLRRNIKELGYEKGMQTSFELLLEEMVANRQLMAECTNAVVAMANAIEGLTNIAEGMKERIESLRRTDHLDG